MLVHLGSEKEKETERKREKEIKKNNKEKIKKGYLIELVNFLQIFFFEVVKKNFKVLKKYHCSGGGGGSGCGGCDCWLL